MDVSPDMVVHRVGGATLENLRLSPVDLRQHPPGPAPHAHHAHPAALGDVDHLLLRPAPEDGQPVGGWRQAHHHVVRLRVELSVEAAPRSKAPPPSGRGLAPEKQEEAESYTSRLLKAKQKVWEERKKEER